MTTNINAYIRRVQRGQPASQIGDMNRFIREGASRGNFGLPAQNDTQPPAPEAQAEAEAKHIPIGNAGSGTNQEPPAPPPSMNNFIRLSSGRMVSW